MKNSSVRMRGVMGRRVSGLAASLAAPDWSLRTKKWSVGSGTDKVLWAYAIAERWEAMDDGAYFCSNRCATKHNTWLVVAGIDAGAMKVENLNRWAL